MDTRSSCVGVRRSASSLLSFFSSYWDCSCFCFRRGSRIVAENCGVGLGRIEIRHEMSSQVFASLKLALQYAPTINGSDRLSPIEISSCNIRKAFKTYFYEVWGCGVAVKILTTAGTGLPQGAQGEAFRLDGVSA